MPDLNPAEPGNEDASLNDLRERAGTGGIGICVTDAEIAGATATPSGNPAARALRRYYPRAWFVTATESRIEITCKDGTRTWALPEEAAVVLAAALDGKRVEPFQFIIPAEPDRFRSTASRARGFPAAGSDAA